MKIHTDCRLYRGDIPCAPNKARGKECPDCDEFDPIEERILIVKLGAPGDVLRTTSLLPGIKKKYPRSEITWLTRSNAKDLLANLPDIDRILTIEDSGVTQVRGETFDLTLGLDNDPLASSVANQTESKEILGYRLDHRGRVVAANPEAEEWLRMALFDRVKKENEKTYQELMRQIVGLPSKDVDPVQIRLSEEETERANRLLHDLGLSKTQPVAFNTGSGDRWKTKRWPMESFLELSLLLADRVNGRILLLGGPSEDEDNRLLATERTDRFVYPGVLPVRDFMALVATCRLLVTADTMAMHVGLGTGVPTLALFGSTSAAEIEGTGRFIKEIAPVDCVCCYLKTCDKQPFCMDELAPEAVYASLSEAGWLSSGNG